jgi:GNAT superfamily N-acetyltransferase
MLAHACRSGRSNSSKIERTISPAYLSRRSAADRFGFISFGRGRDEDRHASPEIYSIYVLKEHWACGPGYRLYQKAREHFRRRGFLRAYLWVLDTNQNAIMAYVRWGGRLEEGCLKNQVIGGQPVKELWSYLILG